PEPLIHQPAPSPDGQAAEALRCLLAAGDVRRRVFVDFDHTLFLANSTEVFLDSARPAFLAALVLRGLGLLRPWRWLSSGRGERVWRDPIRVLAVLALMPWTVLRFRHTAAQTFARHQNRTLVSWLAGIEPPRLTIVSYGFAFVIRRLVARTPLAAARLVASGLRHPGRLRAHGKVAELARRRTVPDPERDVVITDSPDDGDLLRAVRHAFLVTWPQPPGRAAHGRVYVPFFYTARVKMDASALLRVLLLDDFAMLALGFLIFQPFSPSPWVPAVLLFLAFHVTYETGYQENDRIGALREARPKLGSRYAEYRDYRVAPQAWAWAAALGGLGFLALDPQHATATAVRLGLDPAAGPQAARAALGAVWLGLVVACRLVFWLFNRVPLSLRIYLFLPLHLLKYGWPLALFTPGIAGYALLGAQVTRTWAIYAVRRSGGDLDLVVSHLLRLLYYPVLLAALAAVSGRWSELGTWQAGLIAAFCLLRSVPEVRRKLGGGALRAGWRARSSARAPGGDGAGVQAEGPEEEAARRDGG
ncbi:MAG: haloacid dehalogenase-like hydrolase, partial [Candidatus Latescibacterota bacterium]